MMNWLRKMKGNLKIQGLEKIRKFFLTETPGFLNTNIIYR